MTHNRCEGLCDQSVTYTLGKFLHFVSEYLQNLEEILVTESGTIQCIDIVITIICTKCIMTNQN